MRSLPKSPGLDGLRGFAVLAVVLFHYGLLPGGFSGVNLFFTLSGFLITSVLLNEWRYRSAISLKNFFMRRVLRLVPALVVAVLVAIPAYLTVDGMGAWAADAAASLTYTLNLYAIAEFHGPVRSLTPMWSLAVEEQFYLTWAPLLAWLLARRIRLERVLLGLIAAVIVVRLGIAFSDGIGYVFFRIYLSPLNFDQLLIGALAAVALDGPSRERIATRVRGNQAAGLVALALLAVGFAVLPGVGSPIYALGMFSVISVLTAVVIFHVWLAHDGRVAKVLRVKPLLWLGERSYGIYVYHYAINVTCAGLVSVFALRIALAFVITLAVAELSWRYVETPFLRRKHRYSSA